MRVQAEEPAKERPRTKHIQRRQNTKKTKNERLRCSGAAATTTTTSSASACAGNRGFDRATAGVGRSQKAASSEENGEKGHTVGDMKQTKRGWQNRQPGERARHPIEQDRHRNMQRKRGCNRSGIGVCRTYWRSAICARLLLLAQRNTCSPGC